MFRCDQTGAVSGTGFDRPLDFYLPMERLLSEADFRFMASQPGITRAVVAQMRADRRRVFRNYLQSLTIDFNSLARDLRLIMVQSPQSRDDLAASLLSAHVIFVAATMTIHCKLLLHACGFHSLTISAGDLTEGLAHVRRELEHFAMTPSVFAS